MIAPVAAPAGASGWAWQVARQEAEKHRQAVEHSAQPPREVSTIECVAWAVWAVLVFLAWRAFARSLR